MVSGNENNNNLILDPGYIGTMYPGTFRKIS